jgi:hypothetical protein
MLARLFEVIALSNMFQHYTPLLNMPEKNAAHQKKDDEAVRICHS